MRTITFVRNYIEGLSPSCRCPINMKYNIISYFAHERIPQRFLVLVLFTTVLECSTTFLRSISVVKEIQFSSFRPIIN